jgi:hypothetical protein
MKHTLLAATLFCGISAFSQVTLFQDNFQSGAGNWTLNTGSGDNQWIVNNEYLGFSPFIIDTPNQPSSFTGGSNSSYLHIYNLTACSGLSVCNASFDTGSASNQNAEMATSINTTGFSSVTLSFWYLSAGAANTSYGTIEYSTNNGSSWTSTGTNYVGVSAWTQTSVTLPAFSNVAQLKFRFKWQNGGTGLDPAFAIDELTITGTQGNTASISTNAITTQNWCYNSAISLSVPFTVTGTMNPGNIYTAELSDASGSFAAPTVIGTLNSTGTGAQNILCNIPAGTPAGNGYRIRVNSSSPASTGTDTGTNLVMHDLPVVAILGNPLDGTICAGQSATMIASGAVNYIWTPATGLSSINTAATTATPSDTITYSVIGTDQNGCNNTATFTVNVNDCASVDEIIANFTIYPNPASDLLYVNSDSDATIQEVYAVAANGQRIALKYATSGIHIAELAQGTYTLEIKHTSGISYVRFVKQ